MHCVMLRGVTAATFAARPQAVQGRGAPGARALRREARRCSRTARGGMIVSASYDGDSAGGRVSLDYGEALKVLGLKEGAGFDEIVAAKNHMLSQNTDMEMQTLVDTAYDVLLMGSLTKRRSGVVTDSRVKYADVPRPVKVVPPPKPAPSWAAAPLKALPSVQVPEPSSVVTQGAVFGVLALLSLAQGLTHQPGAADVLPGTELAVGLGASVYFLRTNRNVSLARAFGLSMAGLAAGAAVGGLLQGWLRLDIVPLGGLSSPATLVSETALVGLFSACTLLL